LFFGIDIAFTKVFAKGKNAWVYVFFQLIILTIMSFVYALPFEKNLAFSWNIWNLLILLFLGVGCTAICWVLRTVCIRNVSAVTCAVLMPMAAVIATLASIICKMENFSWNVVVGGIIITLAIILSGLYDAHVEKKELLKQQEEERRKAAESEPEPDIIEIDAAELEEILQGASGKSTEDKTTTSQVLTDGSSVDRCSGEKTSMDDQLLGNKVSMDGLVTASPVEEDDKDSDDDDDDDDGSDDKDDSKDDDKDADDDSGSGSDSD